MYNENIKSAKRAEENIVKLLETVESEFPGIYKKSGISKHEIAWSLNCIKTTVEYYCSACKNVAEAEYISTEDKFEPVKRTGGDIDSVLAAMDQNWEKVQQIDIKCKKKGTILGRYFTVGVADGYAVYQVTAIKGDMAYVESCPEVTEYTDYILGNENWIDLQKVEDAICRRDKIDELMKKKKGEQ